MHNMQLDALGQAVGGDGARSGCASANAVGRTADLPGMVLCQAGSGSFAGREGAALEALGSTDPTTVGNYQLTAVLGNGGMGRVYLGHSPSGRRVAIKVIQPDLVQEPEILYRQKK